MVQTAMVNLQAVHRKTTSTPFPPLFFNGPYCSLLAPIEPGIAGSSSRKDLFFLTIWLWPYHEGCREKRWVHPSVRFSLRAQKNNLLDDCSVGPSPFLLSVGVSKHYYIGWMTF